MNTFMHCWYIHFTTNTLNQGFYHYIPSCLQCVHACIAATFNLNQVACIKVFVIIFHCVHNAYMHALLILSLHTKYPDSGFLSLYPFVFAMHACMHALLIHSTHNKNHESGFCHNNLLCLQWIHSCIDWYIHFTTNTLNQGFYHYIPSCLQCVHACIAATFNLNQIACIKVFVIIFHCVHNAYMHALLILSLYTKYPDSGFLSLYPFVFAMHACMHCCYIQLKPNCLN